jgi:Permease, similar to cation transporters
MSVRDEVWTIYHQTLPVMLIALLGGLIAGVLLEEVLVVIERLPGLLVMVPVFLATRGNVYAALGGRIASGLHQGLIAPRFRGDPRLIQAIIASFINAIAVAVVIAVISWSSLLVLGRPVASLFELIAIMLIASVLAATVLIVGLLSIIFTGYRRGIDPDNLVGPVVTTLGDIFGMVSIVVAVMIVEGIPL